MSRPRAGNEVLATMKPVFFAAAVLLAAGWAAAGRAQVIERVSVANDGSEARGESIIVGGRSAMSADGRYVVFESGDLSAWSLVVP